MKIKINKNNKAFSLVEVIVALGVFAILAAGIFNVTTGTYRNFYGTGDKQAIAEFAKEGIEATRAIRDNFWQDIENVSGNGNQGIVKAASGYWQFSGSFDTLGVLTRTIAVTDVERDANDEIVASGGTVDPNTKKVTVTVSGSGIDNYVLTTYLTNWGYKTWEQSDWSGIGDREFWSDMTMSSSSYSNISTSTVGELALSQIATPGAILGDWTSFATSTDYDYLSWKPVYDLQESPDGNILYIAGNVNFDLQAYDIEHIRSGVFDPLWYSIMNISIYTIEVHPNGHYAYIGSAGTPEGGTLVQVVDLTDGSVVQSITTDDPATGGNIGMMDFVINADNSKLFGISTHGGFYPYSISVDGSTLTPDIVGGGGDGNLISRVFTLSGYTPQRIWIDESGATDYAYVTSDDSARALAKYDITDPSNIVFLYSYTGTADYNGLEFIGNTGGNTFAVSTEESASELKIFQDNGSSFDLLDSVDPGSFESSPKLVYDGDNTVILYNTTALDMVAYNVSDPSNITQVFSPDTTTHGATYTTWPQHYLEYAEKTGGLFFQDYIAGGELSFLDFVPRPETRNTGSGYDYTRTITIDSGSTKVVGGPYTNFPVLIGETLDSLKTVTNGGKVKHDYGYDIIFTSDSAGTNILNYEIEKYSSSTGEFIAWVDVPNLSTNTNIYMFYGNSNIVTSQERVLDVWDSNYKFITHMNNRNDYVNEQKDITSYRNHLTNYNQAAPSSDGKIGNSFIYDGDTDYTYNTYSDDFNFVDQFTWSVWVRIDGVSTSTINGLVAVTGNRFYASEANPAYFKIQLWDDSSVVHTYGPTNSVFNWGEWTKIDVTFNRPTITLYRNGSSIDTYTADHNLLNDTTGSLDTGTIQSNAYWMNGHLDELRLSNVARSAGWIKTNYNNQNSTSTFYTIGSEATAGGYNTPGTLYSSILDLGSTDKELRSITVEQNIPSGCSLQITAEVSDDASFPAASIISEVYDDVSSSYYTSSTSATLNGKRYLRYKADMTACNSDTDTPILYGAKFNYR